MTRVCVQNFVNVRRSVTKLLAMVTLRYNIDSTQEPHRPLASLSVCSSHIGFLLENRICGVPIISSRCWVSCIL